MATNTFDQRLREAAEARRSLTIPEVIGISSVVFLIGLFIGAYYLSGENPRIEDAYWTNIITEGMGVFVTVVILGLLGRWYAIQDLKKRLVRQAGSVNHQIAINAVEELRQNRWLLREDKEHLLRNADLARANLEHAFLFGADLDGARLSWARLRSADFNFAQLDGAKLIGSDLTNVKMIHTKLAGADLHKANLNGSDLRYVNLKGAQLQNARLNGVHMIYANLAKVLMEETNLAGSNLVGTNIRGSNLIRANLSDCDLAHVDLSDSNLFQSNLKNCVLYFTHFNENTVLPDAENIGSFGELQYDKYWTPETDMTRYTDPNHPDFWQPDWAKEKNEE